MRDHSTKPSRPRRLAAIAGLLACAVALAATPASASVATLPFEEAFGPAEQPLFNRPGALAFEAAAGDLIVAERSAVNEEQELRIEAASGLGGTYELSFAGQTTGWEGEATLPAAGQAGSGDLLGAEGTGTVTARSDEITGVDTTSGAFAVGQEVEVLFERGYVRTFQETKIVEINGTTIKLSRATDGEIGVSEVRAIRAGSTTVSNFSGPFAAGQAISGTGIQDGTTITAVGAGTLTLSKVAVDTASGVSLLAGPAGASSILTASGALVSGERISGPGIQPGTVVSNVNEGAGTFTLSKPVTAAGPAAGLAADLPYDARAITVAAALKKLPALGDNLSGDKSRARPDNEFSPIVRAVEFTGTLAAKPAELISCDGSGLTGTAPTCSVSELNHGRRAGLYRYHADGTPAPFATLGTNVIDGMRGYGGKPCAEEPSSCDETPQGQLNLNEQAFGLGVAIDESGTATDGDIYVTQVSAKVVDVFAPDGHYLGQLSKYTEAGKEKTLGELSGVAVDDSGALYVADRSKSKIRKFVSQGAPHDPLVDADNTANFNTVLEPTSLAVGTGPTAGSLFATSGRGPVAKLDAATGTEQYKIVTEEYYGAGGVAVNTANGRLFVAMQSELTVREYDASGALAATLLAQTPPIGPQWAAGIAVDPSSGQLHLTLEFGERGQRYVETYGALQKPSAVTKPTSGLAGTSATLNGAANPEGVELESCSFEWGFAEAAYEHAEPCAESPAEIGSGGEPVPVHLDVSGLSGGTEYHYRLVVVGPAGASEGEEETFITARPPAIEGESVRNVTDGEALARAEVNPEGFATKYKVEYGTTTAYGQSTPLRTLGAVDHSPHQVGFTLEGLAPHTTYHWRLVADNTDPAVAGTGVETGEDRAFTTFAPPGGGGGCPNQAYRTGASAPLPDCRAYEMVSPLEKENGDILVLEAVSGVPATLNQASLSGSKLAYGSYRAFGDSQSAAYTSQYIAVRGGDGWQSHSISPPRERLVLAPGAQLVNEFRRFSPDLCEAWPRSMAEPALAAGAVAGFTNLYRRTDEACGGPTYEAVTTSSPPHLEPIQYLPLELQGVSANGDASIYVANDNLSPEAPINVTPSERLQLYYQQAGKPLRFVCVLPNGASDSGCSAGTGRGGTTGVSASVNNALSADGNTVFWTDKESGPGKLYVRLNPGEVQSATPGGVCTEPAKACTLAVSEEAEETSGTTSSTFWAAAADGSAAIFTSGEDLYRYEVDSQTTTPIAGGVAGVAGVSEDGEWIYLASTEVRSGANPQGGEPVAGEPNLYRYHAGSFAFVATLSAADAKPRPLPGGISAVALIPVNRTSRVTPDGTHLAFMWHASPEPTGYDNTDAASGEVDAEVYLYDAGANGGEGELVCASCNPSGSRPVGSNVGLTGEDKFWVAAQLPIWENTLYAPRALADSGERLFFESSDALSLRDTNGVADVYQWEALGAGGCEDSSGGYSAAAEGCVELISSGQSAQAASFVDASPSGDDVFFTTLSSLVPQDYGLVDVYDARAGGGFPAPAAAEPECEGEACQHPAAAPPLQTPASASFFQGPAKPSSAKPKHRRCPKGRRKVRRAGHVRCVRRRRAKRHHRHHRAHHHNSRRNAR